MSLLPVCLAVIVLAPALGGWLTLGLRLRPAIATVVSTIGPGLALVAAGLALADTDSPTTVGTIGALPLGALSVPLELAAGRPELLVAAVVALVGLCVQVYSVRYLDHDPRRTQFQATVAIFLAGMQLVVLSGDLLVTLVGWEVMAWCSWLLIGHSSRRESARRAAFKAFLVTRTADIGFVLGIAVLAAGAHSTGLAEVIAHWTGSGADPTAGSVAGAGLTIGMIGIISGVAGKSGLVPFHDWLPDAMEGPTPASALIHAATMVAAGTVVLTKLTPLLAAAPVAVFVLAVLASVTMVWAAALAMLQSDVKRLLAYSTLSQVAIMLAGTAFGTAAITSTEGQFAGLGHLVGHAFFKSLLFLVVGWLALLAGGTSFVVLRGRLAGAGRPLRSRGLASFAMLGGLAALAGIPPLIGFFSKDAVIAEVFEATGRDPVAAGITAVALLLTVGLSAAYATRAWLLLTSPAATLDLEPVEPTAPTEPRMPALIRVVLAVLLAGTVVGAPLVWSLLGGVHLDLVAALASLALVAIGGGGVLLMSRRADGTVSDVADRVGPGVRLAADRGMGVDRAYVAIGLVVQRLAEVVVLADERVVDAYPRAAAISSQRIGGWLNRAHAGSAGRSLVAVGVGVVLIVAVGVFTWR